MFKYLSIAVAITISQPSFALLSVDPVKDPDKPRNAAWLPLGSLVLPGLGQYAEGQYSSGAFYTGVAAGGLYMASEVSHSSAEIQDLDDRARQYTVGMQLYLIAGEMSAFHTFRTRIETLKPHGFYNFVGKEKPTDLMLAPIEFEHALRPTTFIPLLGLLAIEIAGLDDGSKFDFSDGTFTGVVSYNAGVGEEAMFRGYLMPVLHQSWNNRFWSNAAQSVVFGAAHISEHNKYPIIQGAMGFYLGWLTQRNAYSLRQAIFLHTWWDVIAIGFGVANANRNTVAKPIPLISLSF